MALKQVVLSRKLGGLQEQLRSIEAEAEELRKAREDWQRRSDEAEAAVNEVTEETSEEDVAAVEAAADELIAEEDELKAKEADNENKRADLQEQIAQVENELNELNSRARDAAKQRSEKPGFVVEKKESVWSMETRKVMGLTYQERATLFGRDDVKGFFDKVRSVARQERAVSNGELLIPEVLMGLIRENMGEYSKLYKHVNVRRVPGRGRMLIDAGTVEAVWTEACGALNELDMSMYMTEFDGYKVGGFIPVCNALLEDANDPVSLGTEILTKINAAIGYALDKAIIWGTGVKMPKGILTRFRETEAPADAGQYERPWTNILETNYMRNVVGTNPSTATAEKVWGTVVAAASMAKADYTDGKKFWVMNSRSYSELMSWAVAVTGGGALVGAMNKELPVVGGTIEILEHMPNGLVLGGYGSAYVLAERAGTSLGSSSEVRFVEDQTVFRGTARYDGKPVIPEAFAMFGITGDPLAGGTSILPTFAQDKANAEG